jgi:hypothetical protein
MVIGKTSERPEQRPFMQFGAHSFKPRFLRVEFSPKCDDNGKSNHACNKCDEPKEKECEICECADEDRRYSDNQRKCHGVLPWTGPKQRKVRGLLRMVLGQLLLRIANVVDESVKSFCDTVEQRVRGPGVNTRLN